MKEFISSNKITYNLMSFTAFKTLLIFSLLLESPKSYEEITEFFEKHEYIKEKISVDAIRVYINSLRKAGCDITKTKRSEGNKLILSSHPFELKITPEQIKAFAKVYKTIAKNINIEELFLLEKLLIKLCKQIHNEEFTATVNKISILKDQNIDLLEKLHSCCKENQQIIISYNSPRSGINEMEVICENLGFENGKLYLYCISLDYSQMSYLQTSRIIEIKEIKKHKSTNLDINEITISYELRSDSKELQLKPYEKILSIDNKKVLIEAKSSNKFMLKQRVLSFGNQCRVISDDKFKQEIILTLQKMRNLYEN